MNQNYYRICYIKLTARDALINDVIIYLYHCLINDFSGGKRGELFHFRQRYDHKIHESHDWLHFSSRRPRSSKVQASVGFAVSSDASSGPSHHKRSMRRCRNPKVRFPGTRSLVEARFRRCHETLLGKKTSVRVSSTHRYLYLSIASELRLKKKKKNRVLSCLVLCLKFHAGNVGLGRGFSNHRGEEQSGDRSSEKGDRRWTEQDRDPLRRRSHA